MGSDDSDSGSWILLGQDAASAQGPVAGGDRAAVSTYLLLSRRCRERRRRDAVLKGEVPSPLDIPPGCPFHPRCPIAEAICRSDVPPETRLSETQTSRCHFAGQQAMNT